MAGIAENLGSTFLDNANGILGNVAKAVLLFPDIRPDKIEKVEATGKSKSVGIFNEIFENFFRHYNKFSIFITKCNFKKI
mgnify:CR=1 FL=1